MASEFWLDVGSGMDAEHWSALEVPANVRRVAMDPLMTSGMITSGRLAKLDARILRVGGEIRPPHSLEPGKELSFLPFRSGVFHRVHCGFMLHLYLELLELLAEETHRVLVPGGRLEVMIPHFGDAHSEGIRRRTTATFERCYGTVEVTPFAGPFTTFWGDLYRDKTYRIACVRA